MQIKHGNMVKHQDLGSGSFNRSSDDEYINGGGSYTIIGTDGSVVGSGTWTAKEFVSFEPHAPGKSLCEGGRLELNAFFDGTGEGSLNGLVDVVIQCSIWGDVTVGPGYPWPPDFVEVGPYTNPLTGAVMFNLNQYQ